MAYKLSRTQIDALKCETIIERPANRKTIRSLETRGLMRQKKRWCGRLVPRMWEPTREGRAAVPKKHRHALVY